MNAQLQSRIVLLAALLCAGTILAACGHDHNSFYPLLADADRDGEITHGWVPEFLPKTSRNVHEAHDLSPEYEWCAFDFDPAESTGLKDTIKSTDPLLKSVMTIPNPHVSWWPQALKGTLNVEELHSVGLQLYVFRRPANAVETATYLFAVDWQKGRGYFYTR